MATITALVATLSADTSGFTAPMNRSAQLLRQWDKNAAQVFAATRTPLDNYQNAVKHLNMYLMTGRINQDTYARAVKQAANEYRAAATSASGLGQALSRGFRGIASMFTPIGAGVAAIGTATAALTALGAGAAAAGVQGVKLAADYEQTEVAFTTMLGSAQLAKSTLDEITQFAAATPFEFPELTTAARNLLAFGVSADQLIPTLSVVGDVASGIGQPLGDIAEIYGKVRTQGRLYGDDIRQLGGRGIPIIAELAKIFGVAEGQVAKLVEGGKVGFSEFQQVFSNLTSEGGRFHGMTAEMSQTLTGLSSTLNDNVNIALREFGANLANDFNFKGGLKAIIGMSDSLGNDLAPILAMMTHQTIELSAALTGLDSVLEAVGMSFESDLGILQSLHLGFLKIDQVIAMAKGDMERLNRVNMEMAKVALRNTEPQTATPPAKLRIESRGPDTTAQDKAAKDFQIFAESLDGKFEAIGKSSEKAKLDEFFKLAQSGRIKLDTAELDAARLKLAHLEQAQTAEKVATLTADLEKQVATFGLAGNAAKLYELSQQGATQADLAAVQALDAKLAALKRQKEIADFTAGIKKKIAITGQGPDAEKFYDLQQQGATKAELADARRLSVLQQQKDALQQVAAEMLKVANASKLFTAEMGQPFQALYAHLQQLGQQLEQGRITQQQFDRAKERGMQLAKTAVSIFNETRKPLEKFQADLAELGTLFAGGFIDEQTFDRATRKSIGSLDSKAQKNPAALEKGSSEAYSAILRASQADNGQTTAAKQLAEQIKMRAEQEKTNRLLAQRGPQIQAREIK